MKTKVTLAIVIFSSALGNVFLGKGMKQVGDIANLPPAKMLYAALTALLNPWVASGMLLLITFFVSYLTVLSWADLSYVLPATAPSYLVLAALSVWLLGEHVTTARWIGIIMIVAGVALVAPTDARTAAREAHTTS